jgi:hypothetical protein
MMQDIASQSEAIESAGPLPPARSATGTLALDLSRIATVGVAGYACVTSMAAPPVIIHSICLLGRNEPYLDLYLRVPCALVFLLLLAGVAALRIPRAAKLTRCATLVSAAVWGVSVGLTRGWW